MIVSLDELKAVLGIATTDTSQDDYLNRLIAAKTTWVENYTQRRFDAPILHEQRQVGPDDAYLYFEWRLDDSIPIEPPGEDPTDSVHVFRRPLYNRSLGWEELEEDTDWERDGQRLISLNEWSVWSCEYEYMIQYLGGYTAAPQDIRDAVLELAANQYLVDSTVSSDASDGTSGLTSEHIGDFSYSVGSSNNVATRSSTVTGSAGDTLGMAMLTLNRYKRRFA